MNKMMWKYVKTLNDKRIVNDFLEKQGVELPSKLVECIIENNGGRPSNTLFATEKGMQYVFQSLFSYNLDDQCTIYEIYPLLFSDKEVYPIGLEASGNIVCYDYKNKEYVLWNHENNNYEKIII